MNKNHSMPKEAIYTIIITLILFSSVLVTDSFAFDMSGDILVPKLDNKQPFDFTSGIVSIDPDFFTENNFKRYVIFGTNPNTLSTVPHSSIHGIESDSGFFSVSILSDRSATNLISQGYHVIEDFELDFHKSDQTIQDASRIGIITGSDAASQKYNATGNGVTVAIVDTGVDFSNPDIQHALARDPVNNHPIMLDPDGQGIVLTNATFHAYIDENDIIRNYSKPVIPNATSYVYVTPDGVFLDVSQGGKGSNIPIYNSFFPHVGSSLVFNGTLIQDMKIGDDNRNYIKSKSGIYHLGVIYQGATQGPFARVQAVPVLVVDSFVAGVYDTVIPDLSTSWKDYTRFDLESDKLPEYDFDFTDEKPIVLGNGKEFLVYDSNDDGKNDYSAGTFGARVLDVYGAITTNSSHIHDSVNAINGTLLPALDPDGDFFGIMTDFVGHGTSSAASIVSSGKQTYDIYNDSKKYSITGVAPNAKILPVKALWFGDTVYGWLWSAGFENKEDTWKFSGKPRVDIISNSWGVSTFPTFNAFPGIDPLSLIHSALATPHSLDDDYPGVVMVSSAGNSGHGYGTIGLPNAAPFGITVGATTNNVFVGYGPFKEQPRFGNDTAHYNHIVDFSSRGPSFIGDPKPDIMSIGAHGFTPSNVLKNHKDSKDESFSLFGGTSMAAPLVSGVAAVLIEEMSKESKDYDPFLIKNILMSTATDLNNDPLTQGSGLANVETALDYIHGDNGVFLVYNDMSYYNIKKILDPAIENINSTEIGLERFRLPSHSLPVTSWFAGQIHPGERATATFTIQNPTSDILDITINPNSLSLIKKTQFNGTTIPRQIDPIANKSDSIANQSDPMTNQSDAFVPNYIRLSEVNEDAGLGSFFNTKDPIPADSSLMILNVNFPFDHFMNSTTDVYADDLKISSLYLYDWLDNNNDTKVTSDELSMVSRAGSWGTVQELRVSDPNEKFEGIPLAGVYPVPTRYSYWLGGIQMNSTSMDYTLSASYYKKESWPVMWLESQDISVQPQSTATVDVTLVAPSDIQTGVYQGFLSFDGEQHSVNAPVSFVIQELVDQNDSIVIVKGKQSNDVLYGNGYTKGAFDMVNRYMAGDWRQYYFDVQDESINSAVMELSWNSNNTNLSVFVADPLGQIVHTNVPSGVFGHFLGWPSLDWLGNSPFSQGGGFFPIKNKNDTSTILQIPLNQTGTYTILAHSTLFGGDSTTEPITLVAKFTSLSPTITTINMSSQSAQQSDANLEEETSLAIPDTKTIPKNISNTTQSNATTNTSSFLVDSPNSFETGILIGIIIGAAIGIALIFIVRKNQPKIEQGL